MMKTKNFLPLFVAFCGACFLTLNATAQTSADDLNSEHAAVLKLWLATHKGWRLALEKDYNRERLRDFKAAEKAMPFYVTKDFNGDEKEDFAVILIKGGKFAVAVFNAPFVSKNPAVSFPVVSKNPAFYSTELEVGDILYYNKNSKLLLVGPYESDAGFLLIPKGKTYKVKSQM